MNGQPNKLALRSQEWIQTALFQLMEKKPYSHISITEIADRAGLARQTLYRNYQDKDDILLNYLDKFMKRMMEDVSSIFEVNEEMFVTLFRNWRLYAPSALIHNIVIKDRKIRQLIYKSICDYFDQLFNSIAPEQEIIEMPTNTYKLYAHKSLSSIVHLMLIEWTIHEFHLTPEEIGRLVNDLTASIRSHV
ncbi:TetR family transcriptional regulator [Paenibacillus selenitireducens]|uniref:TetR family transcriptional regulator n=1 Tax=Paenibacillus selenitireducens TaxID=1324314 RepID=A0A1T2X121_9BACL|nr:TetR/AcrR family transcriptional regulator [Paenibacillus selenitireducens]OPA73263.1 TetR family transcriptional regulator [Paenibacillus selenitireducens]